MNAQLRKKLGLSDHANTNDKPYQALIRLWTLRMLVPLGGSSELVANYGYTVDILPIYLDLPPYEDEAYSVKLVITALRKKYTQAESRRTAGGIPVILERNIERCAQLFGWNETDKAVIALAILIRTDRVLGHVVGLFQSVTTSRLIDILSIVLGIERNAIRHSLSPKGLLSVSGFLKVDLHMRLGLSDKLSMLSDALTDRLRNVDADPFELLRDMILPTPPGELTLGNFLHIKKTLDILLPYLQRSLENGTVGVNVLIHGAPGTGKTQLALALARELSCDLFEVSSQDEAGDGIDGMGRLRAFRAAQSMLRPRRALILFDEVEDVFDSDSNFTNRGAVRSQKAWMNHILENNPVPVIWLTNNVDCMDPAFLRRFDVLLKMPLPQGRQRERLLDETCGDLMDASTRSRLVEARGLAPAVVQRAARVIRTVQDLLPANQTCASLERLIENTLLAQGHGALTPDEATALPSSYDPRYIAADVDLAEVAAGIVQAKAGRICLYGPPGTGKTAFGRWLATQLDVPLHAKRVSDIVAPYIGQTERNLARIFKKASTEGAVLLLDEVDSFLQDRQYAQRSWEITAVNEMLTQMEAFSGVFIASTNLMNGLDEAALRRFDLKVKFDYLRPSQAWDLFEIHRQALDLPKPESSNRSVVERISNLTPGDFAAVTRQHRFRPIGSVTALIAALESECRIKKDNRKSVGFI